MPARESPRFAERTARDSNRPRRPKKTRTAKHSHTRSCMCRDDAFHARHADGGSRRKREREQSSSTLLPRSVTVYNQWWWCLPASQFTAAACTRRQTSDCARIYMSSMSLFCKSGLRFLVSSSASNPLNQRLPRSPPLSRFIHARCPCHTCSGLFCSCGRPRLS